MATDPAAPAVLGPRGQAAPDHQISAEHKSLHCPSPPLNPTNKTKTLLVPKIFFSH